MLFSSITFLYYFLPITLLAYFVVPKKWKNAILFLASFLFYFWGEPKYSILMAVTITIGYFGAYLIAKAREWADGKWAKIVTWLVVVLPLAFLGIFKYTDFAISTVFPPIRLIPSTKTTAQAPVPVKMLNS